jgi:hypothetical protein
VATQNAAAMIGSVKPMVPRALATFGVGEAGFVETSLLLSGEPVLSSRRAF